MLKYNHYSLTAQTLKILYVDTFKHVIKQVKFITNSKELQ